MVDRLTKFVCFFSISAIYTISQVADLFFREAFKLHELPQTIVNDWDYKSISHFWQELFKVCGTELTPTTS